MQGGQPPPCSQLLGAHSSLGAGPLELLNKDSRFSAETPGTWPAQICSMRTRRCAAAARKLSTFRESKEEPCVSGGWRCGHPQYAEAKAKLGAEVHGYPGIVPPLNQATSYLVFQTQRHPETEP